MRVSLIAALGSNRCIGVNNAMPWHIPEDFKHFKRTTMGKPMVMGRKTFESLPGLLPGRPHIVVSRSGFTAEGAESAKSLEEGLALAKSMAEDEVFIIGGAQIYTLALESGLADRMVLTFVDQAPDGDAFFPAYDEAAWCEVSRDSHEGFAFVTLDRDQN